MRKKEQDYAPLKRGKIWQPRKTPREWNQVSEPMTRLAELDVGNGNGHRYHCRNWVICVMHDGICTGADDKKYASVISLRQE